jgi:type I restriction enzyme M protein
LRLQVDRLWDTARANGVTNPVACVEVLALVLFARSSPPLRHAIDRGDAGAIERALDDVLDGEAAIKGSAAALLTRHHDLAAELLTQADALDADPQRDLIGDVFEHVLQRMASAGHFGQFRTPRHLISFVVALVDPQPPDRVLDPACGTGGFLIGAAQHGVLPAGLRGEEIDASVAHLGQLNVVTHRLDGAAVAVADGLLETSTASVILANPPFGGSVRTEVARRFRSASPKTELLFLEHIIDRLEEGGRAGVIVPWGVVANRTQGADAIRRRLVDEHDLRAVIELPAGAFGPYTDIRTAVLVWNAGGKTDAVFFGRARADGFSLDDRREPIEADDLPALLDAYRREGAGWVDASEVRAGGYLLTPSRFALASLAERPRIGDDRTTEEDTGELAHAIAALSSALRDLHDAVAALEALA